MQRGRGLYGVPPCRTEERVGAQVYQHYGACPVQNGAGPVARGKRLEADLAFKVYFWVGYLERRLWHMRPSEGLSAFKIPLLFLDFARRYKPPASEAAD